MEQNNLQRLHEQIQKLPDFNQRFGTPINPDNFFQQTRDAQKFGGLEVGCPYARILNPFCNFNPSIFLVAEETGIKIKCASRIAGGLCNFSLSNDKLPCPQEKDGVNVEGF